MLIQHIPTDWPNRVMLAISAAKTVAERERIVSEVVLVLRRGDPLNLRAKGLSAEQRDAVYSDQIRRQMRRAA